MKVVANDFNEEEIMRFLIEASDKTNKEFGSDLDLSTSTIEKYKSGKRTYSFKTFMNICKKYNIVVTLETKSRK